MTHALITMLHNTTEQTYHPIFYFEKPFPSGMDEESKIIRYKSQGHHTVGFFKIEEALNSIKFDLKPKIVGMGFFVNEELDSILEWDGKEIPADIQMRPRLNQV